MNLNALNPEDHCVFIEGVSNAEEIVTRNRTPIEECVY